MQDHSVGHSGAGGPEVVEHLDLVTAELRRRIAGIGLAIAELREETGRLRASADSRYPAVAVLDRPLGADPTRGGDEPRVASQPTVIEPMIAAPEAPVGAGVAHVEPRAGSWVAEPMPPWSEAPVAAAASVSAHPLEPAPPSAPVADATAGETIETLGEAIAPPVVEPTLTWVPEPAPVIVVAGPDVEVSGVEPVAVAPAVVSAVAGHAQGAHGEPPAEPEPSLWADGDDEDAAAFEAFFSAEIEPEPSQRWLLSD